MRYMAGGGCSLLLGVWYLIFVVGYFVLQGYDDMRHMISDISDICVLQSQSFWWVILQRKGVDRAAGCLRNFCNKTIQTNLKRHVFGNLAVLAVFLQQSYAANKLF